MVVSLMDNAVGCYSVLDSMTLVVSVLSVVSFFVVYTHEPPYYPPKFIQE